MKDRDTPRLSIFKDHRKRGNGDLFFPIGSPRETEIACHSTQSPAPAHRNRELFPRPHLVPHDAHDTVDHGNVAVSHGRLQQRYAVLLHDGGHNLRTHPSNQDRGRKGAVPSSLCHTARLVLTETKYWGENPNVPPSTIYHTAMRGVGRSRLRLSTKQASSRHCHV